MVRKPEVVRPTEDDYEEHKDADWILVLPIGVSKKFVKRIPLTQWEADELRTVLCDAKPPHARNLVDIMWDNLDHCYAALQERMRHAQASKTGGSHVMVDIAELKGECRGLATQIAVLSAPQTLDDVKSECHQRWLGNRPAPRRTKTKREMRA